MSTAVSAVAKTHNIDFVFRLDMQIKQFACKTGTESIMRPISLGIWRFWGVWHAACEVCTKGEKSTDQGSMAASSGGEKSAKGEWYKTRYFAT